MRKNLIKKAPLFIFVFTLAACASTYRTGTQISGGQFAQFIDKKTTETELIARLGEPDRKTRAGAKEIWYYDFVQIAPEYMGGNINETSAFEFNGDGVLLTHYKTAGTAKAANQ